MPNEMIKLYRISKCRYIEDTSGEGAFRVGGRWNSKGTRLLYASMTISLSMLEVLVHTEGLPISVNMCLGTFRMESNCFKYLSVDDLPLGWNENPCINATKLIGDKFIEKGKLLGLAVPSALIPEEYNVLINPLHKDFKQFQLLSQRDFVFDGRL